jgi:MYXO-CTERM domain-containing protein
MTSWILLIALVALFALAARRDRRSDPPLPCGYDGERQLAELRALVPSTTTLRLP